jgi:hypothetical protein
MPISGSRADREQDKFRDVAGKTTVQTSTPTLITLIDKTGNTNYIGQALPGSTGSQAVWSIMRVVTSGGGTEVLYATNGNFSSVWDNRASLNYA